MKTMKNYEAMTYEEINQRIRELSNILDTVAPCESAWNEAYTEYKRLTAELDERYRKDNQEQFDAFYNKYIKGKRREEIDDEDWSFYSDWHKDMYGFRPQHI